MLETIVFYTTMGLMAACVGALVAGFAVVIVMLVETTDDLIAVAEVIEDDGQLFFYIFKR